jgi:hypothetical protein
MASIFHNLKSEKKCKAATGLSLEQFNALAEVFSQYYKPKSGHQYSKPPVLTNSKEALFFVLHYLKAYPTLENMALYFDIDIRTVCDYLKITKKCLKAALQGQDVLVKQVFKNQSDFDKAFEGVEDLIVDCTEIPVQRPDNQDVQKEHYSGKKNDIQ